MPPSPLIIANANGREVGSAFPGYGQPYAGAFGSGYQVGPYMYGMGVTPWGAKDEAPPPRPLDIRRMLQQDAKAMQITEALTQSIRSAQWSITDGYQAPFIRQALANMDPPLEVIVAQMATASIFARALFEIVWDTDASGRILPVRIAYRPPENTTMQLDQQGNFVRLMQMIDGQEVLIPRERALAYIHNEHRAPGIGVSDIEPVWSAHWEKRNIRALWRIFLARAAMPWTLAQADAQHPQAMRDLAQRIATIKSGGVVGIGPQEKVSTLDAGGTAGQVFATALDWVDQQMTAAVLAQFLDLGQSRVGSFALSRDHSDLFTLGRDAMLIAMGSAITTQVVRRTILSNWPSAPVDKLPAFQFQPLSEADATSLTTLLGQVIAAPQINPGVPAGFITALVRQVALTLGMDADAIGAGAGQADNPALAQATAQALAVLGGALPAAAPAAPVATAAGGQAA